MKLDEAVTYFTEEAELRKRMSQLDGSFVTEARNEQEKRIHAEAAKNNKQLAEWLMELKELRSLKTDYVFFKAEAAKLLKLALDDFKTLGKQVEDKNGCCSLKDNVCPLCVLGGGEDITDDCQWRYAADALVLIGKDIDVPATEDDTNVGRKKED